MGNRESILAAVVSGMGTISIANGYHTDVLTTILWRKVPFAEGELPAINIRDMKDSTTDLSGGPGHSMPELHELTIELDAVCNTSTAAHQMIDDIRKLCGVDETWGGIALRTWPQGDEIIVDDNGIRVLGAMVTIRVDYRTTKFQEN